MRAVFIAGTDTGVGKTIITGLLARYLLEKGYKTITQKWIQTGSSSLPGDVDTHLRLMKLDRRRVKECLPHIVPYSFKFPSSPHLASRLENSNISAIRIRSSFKFLSEKFDYVIVEGIGGVLVPYNKKSLVIDIAKHLKIPVLIVVDNRLGCINHALLTVEAVRKRGFEILGIIFNNINPKEDSIISKDNLQIIARLAKVDMLGDLPYLINKKSLYKKFIPIAEKLMEKI